MISCNIQRIQSISKLLTSRTLSTSQTSLSATNSPLFKLRQKTGLTYTLCREALNKHNNDINQAESWLQAQALAHGLQKATKVRGRRAREGLLGLAVNRDNNMVTLVELNCESDFVAKNQIFKDFALGLTEEVASMPNNCGPLADLEQKFVSIFEVPQSTIDGLDNQIMPIITKLGENVKVQRITHFRSTQKNVELFGRIHAQTGQKNTNVHEIMAGRFGAVVALENFMQDPKRSLQSIGNRLCQHVIGYSPTYIELPEAIRKHLEESETSAVENDSSKAEVTSIEDGDEDSDSENDPLVQNTRDGWPSIMDQTLIMSDDEVVRDYCSKNGCKILFFNRFECGESS